ncbi:MAG: DnaJ C-terminal domain-containing protein [Thermomicrobiaceae bacterium]
MEFKDYYQLLGVSRDADEKEIKRAYRKLARKYHPDANTGEPNTEDRFKEINEAYEVLKDPEKRSRYDRFGADWERYQHAESSGQAAGPDDFASWYSGSPGGGRVHYEYRTTGDSGFSDFFETLFGDRHGGRTTTRERVRRQPQRGQDFEYPVEISLRDAYHGTSRRFDLSLQERCPSCAGTGMNGIGVCDQCGGGGTVPRKRTIEVQIPAGVRTGSRVRVAGQGYAGQDGGPNGDIYLRITVKPDSRFESVGNNLRTDVDVPLYTAVLGGEATVPTVDGSVALTIPPETQNGRTFRLRGKGLPLLSGGDRGDLLARVNVRLPESLSDEERDLFQQLASLRDSS